MQEHMAQMTVYIQLEQATEAVHQRGGDEGDVLLVCMGLTLSMSIDTNSSFWLLSISFTMFQ